MLELWNLIPAKSSKIKCPKLNAQKMMIFSIAILSNCEIDYLQGTEHFDDLPKVFCNHKAKIVSINILSWYYQWYQWWYYQ